MVPVAPEPDSEKGALSASAGAFRDGDEPKSWPKGIGRVVLSAGELDSPSVLISVTDGFYERTGYPSSLMCGVDTEMDDLCYVPWKVK